MTAVRNGTAIRLGTLIGLPALAVLLFRLAFSPIEVDGVSMEPSYRDGDLNLVFKWAYASARPQRGDVVAVRFRNEILLKRIAGLPGESIRFDHGQMYVDDRPIDEPYLKPRLGRARAWAWDGPLGALSPVVVATNLPAPVFAEPHGPLGPDEYWVVGDNRTMPPANHTAPIIHLRDILGKALF